MKRHTRAPHAICITFGHVNAFWCVKCGALAVSVGVELPKRLRWVRPEMKR
jgi:hypothetical protein